MGVPFVPELFCDIDYDKSGKLLSVPESRAPTEALIRERLARVLTKGESKLEFIYSTYGEARLMNPLKHLTMTTTQSNYLSWAEALLFVFTLICPQHSQMLWRE